MSGITADFSGAIAKTKTVMALPKGARYQLEAFSSETIRELRHSVQKLHMTGRGRNKTSGSMLRNIGREFSVGEDSYKLTIGTGVGSTKAVKYAAIQDAGGTTHPRVTPKMRKWAWRMFYLSKKLEPKYRAIALTKKLRLDVHIKGSHWFTSVINRREPVLKQMMDERKIAYVAKQLSGGADAV